MGHAASLPPAGVSVPTHALAKRASAGNPHTRPASAGPYPIKRHCSPWSGLRLLRGLSDANLPRGKLSQKNNVFNLIAPAGGRAWTGYFCEEREAKCARRALDEHGPSPGCAGQLARRRLQFDRTYLHPRRVALVIGSGAGPAGLAAPRRCARQLWRSNAWLPPPFFSVHRARHAWLVPRGLSLWVCRAAGADAPVFVSLYIAPLLLCAAGMKVKSISEQTSLSRRSVRSIIGKAARGESLAPLNHGGARRDFLGDDGRADLKLLVTRYPLATNGWYAEAVSKLLGRPVGPQVIARNLERLRLTRANAEPLYAE